MATCWGYNQAGRLGTGDATTRFEPTPVSTDLRFISIAAGGTHTCAVAQDGRAYCWGYNHLGQLGDGSVTPRSLPAPVATELRFQDVVTGIAHSCARTEGGAAYCWGAAGEGELGTNNPLDTCEGYGCSLVPVPVAGGHAFTALSADAFTCGVGLAGSFCWGLTPTDTSTTPVPMRSEGLSGRAFIQIDVGSDHACGVTAESLAYCWGSDYQGNLGDGPAEGGPGPTLVREAADSVSPL
jgi:alpha-tubulin suppressor-like RCC1 family protein